MENEKEPQRITVYKGTDKDMKCRGMQYEVGKTVESDGAIRCGDKGFHSCEAPLDVLRYYGPANGNRFFEAEAGGKIDRRGADDSKIASSELTIKAEIGLSSLIKAQVEYTRKKATNAGGDWSTNAGGDRSTNAGGKSSVMIGRNGSKAKGGKNSVIVLTEWEWRDEEYVPVCVKAEVVDGERIKADVFYTLKDGELVEVKEEK